MSSRLGTVTDPIWLLKKGAVYFCGYRFKIGTGLGILTSRVPADAWGFPSPEAAAETRNCDNKLKDFEVSGGEITRDIVE